MVFKNIHQWQGTHRIPSSFTHAVLLSYGLLDECIAGLPLVALPLLRDYLGLTYQQIGLLFTVGSGAALLEPIINVFSDQHPKRLWILGGLLLLVLSYVIAGSTPNYALLLLAFAISFPAIGIAVGLAQATLIDGNPAKSTDTMTRWTLLSSIGDILAPLIVTSLAGLHQGWPQVCWLAASLWASTFLVTAVLPFPRRTVQSSEQADETCDKDEESTWRMIGKAMRNPLLLRWGVLTLIPTMVDEVFLGFVALYLRDVLHASEVTIGLILAVALLGSLLGLVLLDRLTWLKRLASQAPHRLLAGMAGVVLAGMLLLLSTHNIWLAGVALGVISLGATGWYPIAQAQAYAQLPGRSGLVRAMTGLGEPFEMVLPAIVGFLASQFGLLAGLAVLGSAPLLILLALIGYSTEPQNNKGHLKYVYSEMQREP
ncbi:MAG TPA: MFS transporter [Ktedonobacteraceae bacterium]|jgi:FSR family fosmidomycin resistance protein-like MFS transporter